MKNLFSILIIVLMTSIQALAQGFPKNMYTSGGCSKLYFEKARKTNKIMGASLGVAGVVSSTFMPLSGLFLLGGLGAGSEVAYSYIEEDQDQNKKLKAPRIRYPLARQYFDITNTLELAKILKENSEDEISEFTPLYLEALDNAKKGKLQYKECKSIAKLEGLSNSELKEVEADIMKSLMGLEEASRNLTSIEEAKKAFAKCALEIKVEETYPIADLLLLRNEMKKAKFLTWRLKSVYRLYKYTQNQASKKDKDFTASAFFKTIEKLDSSNEICKTKKLLSRKKLASRVIKELK